MPEHVLCCKGFRVTASEFRVILDTRLQTLERATGEATYAETLPVPWRTGWKAFWRPLRRDREGNLLVEYTVTAPCLPRTYVRRVRHVQPRPLPLSLGLE
jgi:hypothetical protein